MHCVMRETFVDFFLSIFSEILEKVEYALVLEEWKAVNVVVMFQFHFLRLPEENVAGFSDCFPIHDEF